MSKHTWHITGQGAIGSLWAYGLSTQDQAVTIINRHLRGPAQIQRLAITHITGQTEQFRINSCSAEATGNIQQLIMPLKAFDIVPAFKQIQSRLSADCQIILCHNGMGTIEQIKPLLSAQQRLYFATTTHGAYKTNSTQVVHSGLGETKIGPVNQSAKPFELPCALLGPISWHQDMAPLLWQKLAINCVINPLTAIEQCNNGQLADKRFSTVIKDLCHEISLTAQACDIPLSPEPLFNQCQQVIKATANNFSSMYQDVKHQRKTEINYITGYLLQQGEKHQVDLPTNHKLYHQLKHSG